MKRIEQMRVVIPVLIAAWSAVACGEVEKSELATPARPVVVAPVSVRDFEEQIVASGELLAKHQADVSAQIAGEITEIHADEGDPVAEGDIVLKIDPERRNLDLEVAQAGVGEAQAAVAERKRELRRVSALAGSHIAAESKLDQAETGLKTARARLRAARAQLGSAERAVRDATVRARFPGHIARRWVDRGEFVSTGQKLFELVSLDPIEVEFYLPEADTSRVKLGDPIRLTVAPYPDEEFEAVVDVVSPTIDRRTRTLRVKAMIANEDGRLSPGLFARAYLGVARHEGVVTVPEEAILQRADGSVVFKLTAENRVERRVVRTGVIRDGWVEIVDGLVAGDAVVRRGHSELVDGSAVVPRNPDGSLAEGAARTPHSEREAEREAEEDALAKSTGGSQ
jgi:membrane fusion protein (multidrug efflux system)